MRNSLILLFVFACNAFGSVIAYWHGNMWSSGFTAGVTIMALTWVLYQLLSTNIGRITILWRTRRGIGMVGRGVFWSTWRRDV